MKLTFDSIGEVNERIKNSLKQHGRRINLELNKDKTYREKSWERKFRIPSRDKVDLGKILSQYLLFLF